MGWCILALAAQFGGGWRSDQEWGLPRKSYIGPARSRVAAYHFHPFAGGQPPMTIFVKATNRAFVKAMNRAFGHGH